MLFHKTKENVKVSQESVVLFFLSLALVLQECQGVCSTSGSLRVVAGERCNIPPGSYSYGDVIIENGGIVDIETSGSKGVVIQCGNSFDLHPGGQVLLNGINSNSATAPGADGTGGSHAGRGGAPKEQWLSSSDSPTYGSVHEPLIPGFAGAGSGNGKGGGALKITSGNEMKIDGIISADGGHASGNGGGGSGGSVWLVTQHLSGYGVIGVTGGNGAGTGGGGGGGRVSLKYQDSTFGGQVMTYGGLAGGITDNSQVISASGASASSNGQNRSPTHGRLDTNPNCAWQPSITDANQWLEISYSESKWFTTIQTRGGNNCGNWVKTFSLQYYSGTGFVDYQGGLPFTGNTDASSIKTNSFPYPVYTNKWRIRPITWNGQIYITARFSGYTTYTDMSGRDGIANVTDVCPDSTSNPSKAENGGPGTVFYDHTSNSDQWVVVNNIGRLPRPYLDNSCTTLNPVTSGGVSSISNYPTGIDYIQVEHGGQVILHPSSSGSLELTRIQGDESGAVYVASGNEITIGESLKVPTIWQSGSKLLLKKTSGAPDITFHSYTNIQGDIIANTKSITLQDNAFLHLAGGPHQSITTVDLIVQAKSVLNITGPTNSSTERNTIIQADKVDVQKNGLLSLDENGLLNFTSIDIKIQGVLTKGTLDVDTEKLKSFITTSDSEVEFSSGRLGMFEAVPTLNLGGNVTIHGGIDISQCHIFSVDNGGTINMIVDSLKTPVLKLACDTVNINGTYEPPVKTNFSTGSSVFKVGSSGKFVFDPASNFMVDTLEIAGLFESNSSLNMRGMSKNNIHSLKVNSSGVVSLDAKNQATKSFSSTSYIGLHNGIIDGTMKLGKMSTNVGTIVGTNVTQGWDILSIQPSGEMYFKSHGDSFQLDDLQIAGTFEVYSPIELVSNAAGRVLDIVLSGSASVKFDSLATQPCGQNFTGRSEIQYKTFTATESTKFNGGDLTFEGNNAVIDGDFYYSAYNSSIKVDNMIVNGKFESCNPVVWNGLTATKVTQLTIGGEMKLDSLADHTKKNWTKNETTVMNVDQITFAMAGKLYAGYLSIGTGIKVLNLEGSGTVMEFEPVGHFEIDKTVVNGRMTSYIGMSTSHYIGNDFTIGTTGLVDFGYQEDPPNCYQGSPVSNVTLNDHFTIHGALKAGSLFIKAINKVDIGPTTGKIDVNHGGFNAECGLGKGITATNRATGATHAGRGGRGSTSTKQPVMAVGDIFTAGTWGSGGGSYQSSYSGRTGGRGGGKIQIETNDFNVNGMITMNGANGGSYAGGGAGGSLWVNSQVFTGTSGHIYANGGNGLNSAGGGAGGWIVVYFSSSGNYKTGFTTAKGGSGGESGGPGVTYFQSGNYKNIRVDNKCQKPTVSLPSGDYADQNDYNQFVDTGSIVQLQVPYHNYGYTFSLVEIYGGAHLAVAGNETNITTTTIVGDDTGAISIAPNQLLDVIGVEPYHRVNVTYTPYIYNGATWKLPTATVEFRERLAQTTIGSSCTTSYLRSNTYSTIWGHMDASRAHVLVAEGATLQMNYGGQRHLMCVGITIQNSAALKLRSWWGKIEDVWTVNVVPDPTQPGQRDGILKVEGGGSLEVDNFQCNCHMVDIDSAGTLTADYRGLTQGLGNGVSRGGGSYGGRGGVGSSSSYLCGTPWGSLYNPQDFGSGGGSASNSSGAGGGVLRFNVAKTMIVDGTVTASGRSGSTNVGGGSGGSILLHVRQLEGHGIVQANGADGGSSSGGGSGGRIALYWNFYQWWFGSLKAIGGTGHNNAVGGAGTIYINLTNSHVKNETLILDNSGRAHSTQVISTHDYSNKAQMCSRTWIEDNTTSSLNEIQIRGKAHLALDVNLKDPFGLLANKFRGDKTGTLHIGNGQHAVISQADDLEFLVDVYVYEGGTLFLPPEFTCYHIEITVWGTIAVHDLTIGDGCKLYLSTVGTSRGTLTHGRGSGIFAFDSLTVNNGGEVTMESSVTEANEKMNLVVGNMRVKGGGMVHAVHVNIEAGNLTVDDLGHITGDTHSIACTTSGGDGKSSSSGASGAGHGGRGGRGKGQSTTGAPYGDVLEPVDRGCKGGTGSVAGGKGGGVIKLVVNHTLQVDGHVSVNGANASTKAGGGSGGSIWIDTQNIRGYGYIQSIGGDGYTLSSSNPGGGASGGRISLYFSENKTYTGNWDVYGGNTHSTWSATGYGASGTVYMYHKVHKHKTLYINNNGRGPAAIDEIDNYNSLSTDYVRTWFLPHHGSSFTFDEFQIYGKAQLAMLTNPVGMSAKIFFHNMIGDRTGALHIGSGQEMDLERPEIDLPFSVRVYKGGFLGLAYDTYIHGVDILVHGTFAHSQNITIYRQGKLHLFVTGNTHDHATSWFRFERLHIKDKGYLNMITDPITEGGINLNVTGMHIDGGGIVKATHLYLHAVNCTIDSGGVLNGDALGYRPEDGAAVSGSTFRKDANGKIINPGLGPTWTTHRLGSGAGHGGGGGRAYRRYSTSNYRHTESGLAYSDLYEPDEFGSAGGGYSGSGSSAIYYGGRGGGRLWLNITDTLDIDGLLSSHGGTATKSSSYVGGGGSGGSIWVYTHVIKGYGSIEAKGGDGSSYSYSYDQRLGGGGSGGRIAVYFTMNKTFSEFDYLAKGGSPGVVGSYAAEPGAAGTVFLYHQGHTHRTLIINNGGNEHLTNTLYGYPYVFYLNQGKGDGPVTWILPLSGRHAFSNHQNKFHFEELQIKGNGHLAFLNPTETQSGGKYVIQEQWGTGTFSSDVPYNVSLFFKYMIGDRTGTVHVGNRQDLDLERPEIDLPFNAYIYEGGHIGLAPDTYVHDVQIHLAGAMSHVKNITLHHNGFLWLKHGGHTTGQEASKYEYQYVRIQDTGEVNAVTNPIDAPSIHFYVKGLIVEGGGKLHGTFLTVNAVNITVDDGGLISVTGEGYNYTHTQSSHGSKSLHGKVNPGHPTNRGSGAGHGGSGGRGFLTSKCAGGTAYGDIYEPYVFGSTGGHGASGTSQPGANGGGILWMNVTGIFDIDGDLKANGNNATSTGSGGGSGGSIWIYTNVLKGYGRIAADGGNGNKHSTTPGAGGGGGRVAMYFQVNATMSDFKYDTLGGEKGSSQAENGGAGTSFVYHLIHEHRTLLIDNGGKQCKDKYNVVNNYADLTDDGCRTWVLPQSGKHEFAHGKDNYHFEEVQIDGEAHFAILTEPYNANSELFFLYMIGDRSGTVHLGENQIMDLHREEIDTPFNVRVYKGGYLGLAPITIIHDITIWLHGQLNHTQNLTVRRNGSLSLHEYGHKTGSAANVVKFTWIRIQDDGDVVADTDPVTENGFTFWLDALWVEGGGELKGTRLFINSHNVTTDDGGYIHSNGYGYRNSDSKDATKKSTLVKAHTTALDHQELAMVVHLD